MFQTYVVSVLSRCCKNRSGVAYVVMCVRGGGTRVPTRGLRALSVWRGRAKYGLGLERVGPSGRSAARRPDV